MILLENRYRVIRELAEGGFGKTFIAEDTQMPSHRRCLIKELKPLNDGSEIYELIKERFQREAVILEDLGNNSSQIPSLYAYFFSEEKFYLVQEYIEGETLIARVQKQGQLSESAVKEILLKILPVLEYVHLKRIVHRDIKPENIILRSGDDTPVLIDFGAVKETMGTVMSPSGNSAISIVIGTPGYMPSEQMIGRPVFASDLYALGLTAIFLLTGKIPGELETNPLTGNIAWQQYALNTSPTLAAVLDKVIQNNLRDRFSTAREMLQALQAQTQPVASTVVATPPTPSEFSTQALIPKHNNINSTVAQPVKNSSNNNVLIGVIIGLLLLISFAGLGFFQYQQSITSSTQNMSENNEQDQKEKKEREFMIGTWQGYYNINSSNSTLLINEQFENQFSGKITTISNRGGTVILNIKGYVDIDSKQITMHEVQVIDKPSGQPWHLGVNTGKITSNLIRIYGTGKDEKENKYSWDFVKQ